MKLFYVDISNNTEITWEHLLQILSSTNNHLLSTITQYQVHFLINLIHSIISAGSLTLNSEALINSFKLHREIKFKNNISTFDNLLDLIDCNKDKAKLTLYTSGTTGQPKEIIHNIESLIRNVKTNKKHKNDVWGLAYSPIHMAGLQVFFQALFNNNTIVQIFNLTKNQIHESISKYNITHISATPTYFRMMLDRKRIHKSVKRITTGGENCDMSLVKSLNKMFPNAEFRNIYASTEAATLFESNSEIFQLNSKIKDKVKINNEELFIHKDLLANSMTENYKSELWYATGDLVEVINHTPLSFKFIGRKNEMINVGGYKVNPEKVELAINSLDGVRASKVFSRNSSLMGKVICAEIELSEDKVSEKLIRLKLKELLHDYEIPRFYTFVEEIKKTETGKMKRDV